MSSAFDLPFTQPAYREPTPDEVAAADRAADDELRDARPPAYADDHDDSGEPLRLSKGARAAAKADGITDEAIRRAIAEPDDLEPDPTGNGRMRVKRGSLTVVVARDGAVLSVRDRKGRRR
ncbi:MAG: hypothetical protein U0S36_13910 [Candidatus Nanopelagicales bacterium]|jgi:hypothetical protein